MLSRRSMRSIFSRCAACHAKNSVIARPIRILARCSFKRCAEAMPGRETRQPSGLVEELHLDARDLDKIVVLKRVRGRADRLAVDGGALSTLDVGDEVALRTPRQHRHLHAGLAKRGQRLRKLEFLAGVSTRQELNGAQRLSRLGCASGCSS